MKAFVAAALASLTSADWTVGAENYGKSCKTNVDTNLPNMQPGLIPPNGIWRGSTIDLSISDWSGADPFTQWEDVYKQDLHIFRTFRNHSN